MTSGVSPIVLPVLSSKEYPSAPFLKSSRVLLISVNVFLSIAEIFVLIAARLEMFKLFPIAAAVCSAESALNLETNLFVPDDIASSLAPSNSAILILACPKVPPRISIAASWSVVLTNPDIEFLVDELNELMAVKTSLSTIFVIEPLTGSLTTTPSTPISSDG